MVHSVSFYNFQQISSDTGPNFEELAAANGMDSFHIELISRRLKELRGETHEASIKGQKSKCIITGTRSPAKTSAAGRNKGAYPLVGCPVFFPLLHRVSLVAAS